MRYLKKLWPYSAENPKTWKYIDYVLGTDKKTKKMIIKKWILNPDFRYKYLFKEEFKEIK